MRSSMILRISRTADSTSGHSLALGKLSEYLNRTLFTPRDHRAACLGVPEELAAPWPNPSPSRLYHLGEKPLSQRGQGSIIEPRGVTLH